MLVSEFSTKLKMQKFLLLLYLKVITPKTIGTLTEKIFGGLSFQYRYRLVDWITQFA